MNILRKVVLYKENYLKKLKEIRRKYLAENSNLLKQICLLRGSSLFFF